MKVLVTGAKGQVGSELVLEGGKQGFEMLATGREELDITEQEAVDQFIRVQKPDIVINAAAYTAVDQAESEPELAFAINRDGAANLARACANNKIPLMHVSTDYVFDGTKKGAYTETDIPNPQCIYGKSKLEGERAIESIMEQYIILRVSWVFGAKGHNFVKTMLRLGRERDVLKVVADQHGGPTWAGAIADALLGQAKRWGDGEPIPSGIYHYSGQPTTTWRNFAEVIFDQAVALKIIDDRPVVEPINSDKYPTLARRPLNSTLDCHKIVLQLDIPEPEWLAGLDCMLASWEGE